MPRKIASSQWRINQLNASMIDEMFGLFSVYYANTKYETFHQDLKEKDSVFMFRCKKTGELLGFSTIYQTREWIPGQKKVTYLFSGDTVMDRSIWGTKHLQLAFFIYVFKVKLKRPFEPVYWMLISKGFKTYMMMRRNFKTSYPNAIEKTPVQVQGAADYFYKRKFGRSYVPEKSLITFDKPKDAVKDGYACPSVVDRSDRDIEFFVRQNPNYVKGDELACIAEMRYGDFPKLTSKYMLKPVFKLAKMGKKWIRPQEAKP